VNFRNLNRKHLRLLGAATACVAVLTLPQAASAHPWLDVDQANPGQVYKAKLHVPHGCDTASTISLVVRTPEGVDNVEAAASGAWKVTATKKGSVYEIAYEGGEVAWDQDGQFEFSMRIGDLKPSRLYIPVIQKCKGGDSNRWIETPTNGKTENELDWPAAFLDVVTGEVKSDASAHQHMMHGDMKDAGGAAAPADAHKH
jgi:periplasmic copper chaperone A